MAHHDQKRVTLRQLGLSTYDVVASSLADARTSATTASKASNGLQARAIFRAWVASTATLLQQLLEVAAHPASTVDGRSLIHVSALTPTVETVGNALLRVRDAQSVSQRLAGGAALLARRPPAPAASRSTQSLVLLRALNEQRVPCFLRNGGVALHLPFGVCVSCALTEEEGASGGRLVLEPELEHESDAEQPGEGAADGRPSILPPLPPLVPLVRYWIGRLHEVVPEPVMSTTVGEEGMDVQGDTSGAVPSVTVHARAVQLRAIHGVLSTCLRSLVHSHIATATTRMSRVLPAAAATKAAAVDGGGDKELLVLRRVTVRGAVVCTQTPSGVLITSPVVPRDMSSRGSASSSRATVASLLGGLPRMSSFTAGLYAVQVGTGAAPVFIGRQGALPVLELSRLQAALADDGERDALLCAIPVQGTTTNQEGDARAFDAATGRRVVAALATRPLPSSLRRLLAWASGRQEEEGETLDAPQGSATTGGLGANDRAGHVRADALASSSPAAAVALQALCNDGEPLSHDFAATHVGLVGAPGNRYSASSRVGTVLMQALCTEPGTAQALLAESAGTFTLPAVRACRAGANRRVVDLAADLLQTRVACLSAIAQAGAHVDTAQEGDSPCLCIRVPSSVVGWGARGGGGLTLTVTIDEDERVAVGLLGPLPPVEDAECVLPTTVLSAIRSVCASVNAALSRRQDSLARTLCARREVGGGGGGAASGPAQRPTVGAAEGMAADIPGFLSDTRAGSVLSFTHGLSSPVGLASTADALGGSISLSSALLASIAQAVDARAPRLNGDAHSSGVHHMDEKGGGGAPVDVASIISSAGGGRTGDGSTSAWSLLGAPLEQGADALLAASLSLRAKHDAECLALLVCPPDGELEEVTSLARDLEVAFSRPHAALAAVVGALALQARHAEEPGTPTSVSSTPSSSVLAALSESHLQRLAHLVRASGDATGQTASRIHQRMQELAGGSREASARESVSLTQRAVARKLAAGYAAALADAARQALLVLVRLGRLQHVVSGCLASAPLQADSGRPARPPVFMETMQPVDAGGGGVPWGVVPLPCGGGGGRGHGGVRPYVRFSLPAASHATEVQAELLLSCMMLQQGQCRFTTPPAASASSVAPTTAAQTTFGVCALSETLRTASCGDGDGEKQVHVEGTPRWASCAELSAALVGCPSALTCQMRTLGPLEAAPVDGLGGGAVEAHKRPLLVVECHPAALAALCTSSAGMSCALLEDDGATRGAVLSGVGDLHRVLHSLSHAGRAVGAAGIILLPPSVPGATMGGAHARHALPEEGFVPTVTASAEAGAANGLGAPLFWAYGPAAALLRRSLVATLGPSAQLPAPPGPHPAFAGSKGGMFRSGAPIPVLRTTGAAPGTSGGRGGAGQPPSSLPTTLKITLPAAAVCAGIQVCFARRWVGAVSVPQDAGATGGGASKRPRVGGPSSSPAVADTLALAMQTAQGAVSAVSGALGGPQ